MNFEFLSYLKFEVFAVVKIDIVILWVVITCLVNEHWWYEVKYCIFRVEVSQLEKLSCGMVRWEEEEKLEY